MMKIITANSCLECPYIRFLWWGALDRVCACGNSCDPNNRPKGEKHWLGGDALPGDRIITNPKKIPEWCALSNRK